MKVDEEDIGMDEDAIVEEDAADEDEGDVSLPSDNDAVEIPSTAATDAETGDGETVRLRLYNIDLSLMRAHATIVQEVDMSEFNVSGRSCVRRAALTRCGGYARMTPSTSSPQRSLMYV